MTDLPKTPKTPLNRDNFLFKEDFKYSSRNPYHQKLEAYSDFVLRDDEGESNCGQWAQKVFSNSNPIEVEIGTGFGEFMMEHTSNNPQINFVGMDHRFKRSHQVAQKLSTRELKNFRYLRARGERLGFLFGPEEVSKIYYFFPDPWPKKRHHKKRLFQQNFLDCAHRILCKEGEILIKTDHDEYFAWMLDVMKDNKQFKITMQSFDLRQEFPEHFLASFVTKFEKIFLSQGTKIKAMTLVKQ